MSQAVPGPHDVGARRTRAEQREVTRQRILDAATDAFTEHGFDGASIDDITARAGFSRGAFYSNFDDKTDLLVQLAHSRVDAFTEQELPDVLELPLEERPRAVASWLVRQEPPIEMLLAVELARLRDEDDEVEASLTHLLEGLISAVDDLVGLQGSGLAQLPPEERRERVLALVAGVTGANLLRHLGLDVGPRTVELVLSGILAPGAADPAAADPGASDPGAVASGGRS